MTEVVDNPRCFICDRPPSSDLGSVFRCDRHPEGPVNWSKYVWNEQPLKVSFVYQGKTVDYIDFSRPGAPSSPA